MKLLEGKQLLVAGVLTETSIAYRVAEIAQEQGASVILTSFGRRRRLVEAVARRLPMTPLVLDFDAEDAAAPDKLQADLAAHGALLNGVVHCISASHPSVVGPGFMTAPWVDVSHSMQVSAYSYQALVRGVLPHLAAGAGVVGCTVDASVAWPLYGWAGVAKAAYESVNRYLAAWLGPRGYRANLVAAGPIRSATMQTIPGVDEVEELWRRRAPMRWSSEDATEVARTILILTTDWHAGTTGEVVHCDAGFHAVNG